ncbi:MAG TPA: GNAT family N-acetyltransferase, partial [Pirellulaceae bacterium]
MGATLRTSACARLEPDSSGAVFAATIGPVVRRSARDFELGCASPGDHTQIHRLLVASIQEPSRVEFQALNDAPRYDACDRLLMRRRDEIAAHLHLVPRTIHFGGLDLPTMDFKHLATLPEYRGRDLASQLLDAGLDEMRRAGMVVATVHTRHPRFLENAGWHELGRTSFSTVNPRLFLADSVDYSREPFQFPLPAEKPLTVRVWRRNELDEIKPWYDAEHATGFGATRR